MRLDCAVVAPPALDDNLGFAQGVEDFAVKQSVAHASIEALDVAVSRRAERFQILRSVGRLQEAASEKAMKLQPSQGVATGPIRSVRPMDRILVSGMAPS